MGEKNSGVDLMTFTVYLKTDEGNQISNILSSNIDTFQCAVVEITDGLLKKGKYYVPLGNILFIKED